MVRTTDYKVILENEHYEDVSRQLSLIIEDREKRIVADRLFSDVKSVVEMEVKRYNYNHSSHLEYGIGGNHIWISQKSTGERVVLITYKTLHRMNLRANEKLQP